MTQELIERLRREGSSSLVYGEQIIRARELANEAADALQSQSARIAELEGALVPFAGHANIVDADGLADMDEPDFSGWSLLAGDFRRARSSLTKDSTSGPISDPISDKGR